MYGALLGDRIGAPYEFDRGNKTKDFPLFSERSHFTDDSVMTIAVAQALMEGLGSSERESKLLLVASMQRWGRTYPNAGYGFLFSKWLGQKNPNPYGSFGNGSAMRVSSAGWLYDSLEETRRHARWSAEVTHNHPEGIKGAEAVASVIFLAREGCSKEEICSYVTREFGYDLTRTCDEIRPAYHHVETCQETVPQAITAFLEGEDFEDVIRTAVSLGGDCDTLTCIAGAMGEAYYGVPQELKEECLKGLTQEMREVLKHFDSLRRPLFPREGAKGQAEAEGEALIREKMEGEGEAFGEEDQQEDFLKKIIDYCAESNSFEDRIKALWLFKHNSFWVFLAK